MSNLAGSHFLAIVAALALSGCTAVVSTRQDPLAARAPKNGFSYFLPKGKVLVTLTWNAQVRSWDVSPTLVYDADVTQRYNLDWKDNFCFDDDISLSEDPSTGLLQAVNANSTDQSVNTSGNFVGAARNLYPLGPTIATVANYAGSGFTPSAYDALARRSPDSVSASSDSYPATAQVVVDASRLEHEAVLVASPAGAPGPRIYAAVKVRLVKKYELGAEFPRDQDLAVPADGKAGGIVVRVPIPYELQVEEILSGDGTFHDSTKPRTTCAIEPRTVMLPDPEHNFLVPIKKRPLVADNVRVGLTNGMVQSLQQIRPSMVGAIIGVPRYLLTAIVPVPFEVKQNQQNVSDSESRIDTTTASSGTASERK